jgi:hypothetical protein
MDPRTEKNVIDEHDLENYLTSNFHPDQVRSILRHKKVDPEKVEKIVNNYSEKLQKIQKLARKLLDKVERKYSHLPFESIMQKAYAYAKHNNFSEAEKQALLRLASKGDIYNTFNPYTDLKYTEMAKFFGSDNGMPVLNLGTKDYAHLDQIVKLYELTRVLHQNIKNNSIMYKDFSLEATLGEYDPNRHNLTSFINPLVVALFISKIDFIERRMLYTNIGRVVLQRAQPFLQKNYQMYINLLNREIESDFELAQDIVKDPNSLAFFSNDTPMSNLLKRFKIQTELWKNVLNLRQGRYYSSRANDENDSISGFMDSLNNYEWSVFDSPDMYGIQDEGSTLRKLLAVFSVRPTTIEVSNFNTHSAMNASSWSGLARTVLLTIPMMNVRLPSAQISAAVKMSAAMQQLDWFVENKMIVPKNKSVIHSREVVFFYTNRRYQSVNYANLTSNFAYQNLPVQSWQIGYTAVNQNVLDFDDKVRIGKEEFGLRSIVCVYKPNVADHVSIGSSCVVLRPNDNGTTEYMTYNPIMSGTYEPPIEGSQIKYRLPFSVTHAVSQNNDDVVFRPHVEKFGTVFVYSK